MKKNTKIISTAIAIVLVMSFMVVGILAATSAAANISASVSWTATEGLDFEIEFISYIKSTQEIDKIKIEVNTTTTNDQASGISKSLNLAFNDPTPEDGVNNPEEIFIFYYLANRTGTPIPNEYGPSFDAEGGKTINMTFTSLPQASEYVNIEYGVGYFDWMSDGATDSPQSMNSFIERAESVDGGLLSEPENLSVLPQVGYGIPPGSIYVIKLSVKNPNVSFSGVNLNWGLAFS